MPMVLLFLLGCDTAPPPDIGARVVIIGIDGGAWAHLDPLIADGSLPNLGRIRAEGATANLKIDSSLSPVSWTTIATGRHPAEHGVEDKEEAGETFASNSNMVKVKRLWDIASEAGRRVFVAHYWLTHPPYPVNGVLIAHQTGQAWPAGAEKVMGREISPSGDLAQEMSRLGLTFGLSAVTNAWLQQDANFDLVIIPYYAWDNGMHRLWAEYAVGADPAALARLDPQTAAQVKRGHAIGRETLVMADQLVGTALSYAGDTGYVMLVSDHGHRLATPPKRRLALNRRYLDGQRGTVEEGRLKGQGVEFIIARAEKDVRANPDTLSYLLSYPTLSISGAGADAERARLLALVDERGQPVYADAGNGELRPSDALLATVGSTLGQAESAYYSIFVNTGSHSLEDYGIFGLYGPDVQAGKLSATVQTVDITPTALWLLGLQVGKDMDGAPVTAAMTSAGQASHKVYKRKTWEDGTRPWATPKTADDLSTEELERLKALGYVQQ